MGLSLTFFLLVLCITFPWMASAQTLAVQDTPQLPNKGLISDVALIGYDGTTYHSIRFEPLCGTLGSSTSLYSKAFDIGDRCKTAMSTFETEMSPVMLYDQAGVQLEGDVIGKQPVCLCFTLAEQTGNTRGDLCLFFNAQGFSEEMYLSGGVNYGYYLAGTYRPNPSSKAPLPQCASVDLAALSESWSATAITDTPAAATNNAGAAITQGGSKSVKATATRTYTSVSTIVDSQGQPISTETFVFVEKLGQNENSGPLSRSDTIALGVGLGLGIPSLVLAMVGVIAKIRRNRAQAAQQTASIAPSTPPANNAEWPSDTNLLPVVAQARPYTPQEHAQLHSPQPWAPQQPQWSSDAMLAHNGRPYTPQDNTQPQPWGQQPQWSSDPFVPPIAQNPRPYTPDEALLDSPQLRGLPPQRGGRQPPQF